MQVRTHSRLFPGKPYRCTHTFVFVDLVDTVNTKAKQYQECETVITRIEVRIMRLRREKGERIKGALEVEATQDPNVPNNNVGRS